MNDSLSDAFIAVICGANPSLDVVNNRVFTIEDVTCPECTQAYNRRLSEQIALAEAQQQEQEIVIPPPEPIPLSDLVHIPPGTRTCCSFGLSEYQRGDRWRDTYELSDITCPACRRNLGMSAADVLTTSDVENLSVSELRDLLLLILLRMSSSAVDRTITDHANAETRAKLLAWATLYIDQNKPIGDFNVGSVVEGYNTVANRVFGIVIGGGRYCRAISLSGNVFGEVNLLWPTVNRITDSSMPVVELDRRNRPSQRSVVELRRYFADPSRLLNQTGG